MQVPQNDFGLLGSRQKKKIVHASLPKHAGGSLGGGLGPSMPKNMVKILYNNCYFKLNMCLSDSVLLSETHKLACIYISQMYAISCV